MEAQYCHGALTSLSQKPVNPNDVTHPQVAPRSAENAAEQTQHRYFHLLMNIGCFSELKMCPWECMVSLNVAGPQQKHFNGFVTVPPRLAFQLFCHCNFTYNCIVTEFFWGQALKLFCRFHFIK